MNKQNSELEGLLFRGVRVIQVNVQTYVEDIEHSVGKISEADADPTPTNETSFNIPM